MLSFAQPRRANDATTDFAQGAADAGEPWISFFTPDEVRSLLIEHGFDRVEPLSLEEASRRYYHNRADELTAPRRISIVRAAVDRSA